MLKHAVLEFHGSRQAGLFINRKEAFDCRMRQFFISNSSQSHRNAYAVVSTERCTFGLKVFAIHICLNRVRHKIMLNVSVFLTNHIHVRLENNTFVIFVFRRGGHAHDDIHRLVGDTFDLVSGGKILQPLTDLLLVFRRTRHLVDLSKNVKNCFWFHMLCVLIVYEIEFERALRG